MSWFIRPRGLRGIRRLVSFAMAVVASVLLLVLDEPTNDVDAWTKE